MTDQPGREVEQRLPARRPDAAVAPADRFTAAPSAHATVGATGPAMRSQWRKQAWKSSAIMRRSFCACR